MNTVELYDTTLRDGSQGEGIKFSVADKLRVAGALDGFGMTYIEGGWPGGNPKDTEFFNEAKGLPFHDKLVAFGMTRRKGMRAEDDPLILALLNSGASIITIVGKTWKLHVDEVLRVSREENLKMIADTISFLKGEGKKVFYDAEHAFDGYIDDARYAEETWQAADQAGADRVVLCDTNGGRLREEIVSVTLAAKGLVRAPIGIHTHNDIGLAVSNAISAIDSGASQVQGTVNGYGERAGNCNLTTLIPILQIKRGIKVVPDNQVGQLKKVFLFSDFPLHQRKRINSFTYSNDYYART